MQWPARIVALTTSCWNNRRVRVLSRVPGRRARRPVRCNTARAKSRAPRGPRRDRVFERTDTTWHPAAARGAGAACHAPRRRAGGVRVDDATVSLLHSHDRTFDTPLHRIAPARPGCTVRSMTMRRRSWWRGAASRRRPRSPRCNANTCCARHCTNAGPPCRKRSCRMAAEPCSSWRIRAGCRYPSQMSRSRGYPRFCGVRFARDCAGRDACGRHRASRACTASLPRG